MGCCWKPWAKPFLNLFLNWGLQGCPSEQESKTSLPYYPVSHPLWETSNQLSYTSVYLWALREWCFLILQKVKKQDNQLKNAWVGPLQDISAIKNALLSPKKAPAPIHQTLTQLQVKHLFCWPQAATLVKLYCIQEAPWAGLSLRKLLPSNVSPAWPLSCPTLQVSFL